MKSKDRNKDYVCTNAIGDRVPIAVFGEAKNPRCFSQKDTTRTVLFAKKNAFLDTVTFQRWVHDVFALYIRRLLSKKNAMIMDGCDPRGTDINDVQEQIKIFTLLSNRTSLHQPMDMGIIAAWKKRYLYHMLSKIMSDTESRQERREKSLPAQAVMPGTIEGIDPHILDVAKMEK